jgi:hypothetical protein
MRLVPAVAARNLSAVAVQWGNASLTSSIIWDVVLTPVFVEYFWIRITESFEVEPKLSLSPLLFYKIKQYGGCIM